MWKRPAEEAFAGRRESEAVIHIYTGDGQGKTSAAAGLCLRMLGQGGRVLAFQFLKDHTSGEITALRKAGAVIPETVSKIKFTRNMTDKEKTELAAFYEKKLAQIASQAEDFDLILLDEAAAAVNKGFIDIDELVDFITKAPCELILTGRRMPKRIIELGDYVSEIKKLRHPFDTGVKARRGIEF